MTFIDWSDPEGMLELLSEYVRDAANENGSDPKRKAFLTDLLLQLEDLIEEFESTKDAANKLKKIQDSIPKDFEKDPVNQHVSDCFRELELLDI